jgi:hypothetical protein
MMRRQCNSILVPSKRAAISAHIVSDEPLLFGYSRGYCCRVIYGYPTIATMNWVVKMGCKQFKNFNAARRYYKKKSWPRQATNPDMWRMPRMRAERIRILRMLDKAEKVYAQFPALQHLCSKSALPVQRRVKRKKRT